MIRSGALPGIDVTDLDNLADGFPGELFAIRRRQTWVNWPEPTD